MMGIGVSLLLIAIGAILTWAVSADVSGVDLNTVGIILMVVGAAGALISLVFWSSWGGFGGTTRQTVLRDRDRVVEPCAVSSCPEAPRGASGHDARRWEST